jgi:hypothetical protein
VSGAAARAAALLSAITPKTHTAAQRAAPRAASRQQRRTALVSSALYRQKAARQASPACDQSPALRSSSVPLFHGGPAWRLRRPLPPRGRA